MKNVSYKKSVDLIIPHDQGNREYTDLSNSVQKNVSLIAENQRQLDMREKIEGKVKSPTLVKSIYGFMSYFGHEVPEWGTLFRNQLRNVRGLNRDLAMLVYCSSDHLKRLERGLYSDFHTAQANKKKKTHFENNVPQLTQDLSQFRSSDKPNSSKSYEEEKQEYESETALTEVLEEVALLNAVTENDKQKINFLKKHISFHRRMLFASKRLAVTTDQMCSTLEHLTGIYETLKPMGECLDGIHEGVMNLRGYTGTLQNLYTTTFEKIDAIDYSNPDTNILTGSTAQLDDLVGKMMQSLRQDLGE